LAADQLPALARATIVDLRAHLTYLDQRIGQYERHWVQLASVHEPATRIQAITGVGPLTASAITASISSGHEFNSGRQFAAWLGLVPRRYSTGGKSRLGRITKRGDGYMRTLLMLGARAVLQQAMHKTDRISRWAKAVRERRGYHRAIIAIAAKNARTIWVVLAKNQPFAIAA
jgi:transposase